MWWIVRLSECCWVDLGNSVFGPLCFQPVLPYHQVTRLIQSMSDAELAAHANAESNQQIQTQLAAAQVCPHV